MTSYFDFIKYLYFMARKYELEKLRKHIKENSEKFVNNVRCGYGSPIYSSKSRLNPPYNLSNWLWIDIKLQKNEMIFISFQPFDLDKNSNNTHTLFDRIGISRYKKRENNSNAEKRRETSEILSNLFITDIELPLDENKIDKLHRIIKYISDNIAIKKFTWKEIKSEIES